MEANIAGNSRTFRRISVAWEPPSEGFVKLNVDGGCTGELGSITAGGVLRDHSKIWLGGFVLNKGTGSALEAEVWGLFEGLKLAWMKGFRNLVVETDSKTVCQLMDKSTNTNHPLFGIIQGCKFLLAGDWVCSVKHVFRESNMLGDGLAKMGAAMDLGVRYFEEPPLCVADILAADARGSASVRTVLS